MWGFLNGGSKLYWKLDEGLRVSELEESYSSYLEGPPGFISLYSTSTGIGAPRLEMHLADGGARGDSVATGRSMPAPDA
eukprot:7230683-Prymnesium_polylepis.1